MCHIKLLKLVFLVAAVKGMIFNVGISVGNV